MEYIAVLKLRKNQIIRYVLSCLFIIVIFLGSFLVFPSSNNKSFNLNNNSDLKSSGTRIIQTQWLKNNNFSTQDVWYYTKGSQGDNSTVEADISDGQANYNILGDEQTEEISTSLNDGTWIQFRNDIFLYPDIATINANGCYVSHDYDENINQTRNYHSVHWKKNVSIGNDMSKFIINTASLEVIFNATVNVNVDTANDNFPVQYGIGDFATFYVLISDLDFTNPYRVANNKTSNLGQDSPAITNITDKAIETADEEDIITALSSSLDKDLNHSNFTITLGIDIYCEDNGPPSNDHDTWEALLIKSFNLTFSYKRKVEKFSSVSWNQIGDKIEGADIQIKNATLNFNYKIDYNWPTALSPFSEIRITINNNRYAETIKLSDATSIFQEVKAGGFDITSLISKGDNITVSIQVFIANTFGLGQNITISIDDVFLNVSLIETFPDIDPNLNLFLNGANKTDTPFIEIPTGRNLNFTIKFLDESGIHISNGLIQLEGAGFVEDFIENITLQQYTVIINTTEKLIVGEDNDLTITTQKINYQSKQLYPTIRVRKINAEFSAIYEDNTITIKPGGDAVISVRLNDTDFDQLITGAVVFYSWESVQGALTDSNNDGIYEGVIRNVPEGSHSITISAYGIEEYNFQDYYLTLNAITPAQPDWTWLIVLLSGAFGALAVVFTLYEIRFKYPPTVRKSRKIRKKIKKGKNTKPIKDITSREDLIKDHLVSNVETIQLEKKTENGLKEIKNS